MRRIYTTQKVVYFTFSPLSLSVNYDSIKAV
jgi:hypothetical protein